VTRDARRALLWLPAAALLLAFGFLAWLVVGAQIAGRSLGPAETAQLRTAFVLYARFVLFKGLLPALALAVALFPLVERMFALERRGVLAGALGIVAASAVASAAVAGLVLPSNLWGDFSVARYAGALHFAETCAEMTAGVAAALVVARWLVRSRARLPVWLSGVAIACIAAGFWLPKPIAQPARKHASAAPHVEPAPPPAATAETPVPAAPAQPAPDYPVTTLPVALLATQVDALESHSNAVIVELDDLSTATLHLGDALANHPEATLERIEAQRVLLERDGHLEQLVVGGHPEQLLARIASGFDQLGGKQPDAEALAYRREAAARLRERIDHPPEPHNVAGGLLADGTPNAVYNGDTLVGFQLDAVRPGGVYDRLGLRDGDRVDAINGIGVGGPGAREAVIAALASSQRFEIAVQRNGRRQTLVLPTATLLRELSGLEANKPD
jgi:general secretion pathway protein C